MDYFGVLCTLLGVTSNVTIEFDFCRIWISVMFIEIILMVDGKYSSTWFEAKSTSNNFPMKLPNLNFYGNLRLTQYFVLNSNRYLARVRHQEI